MRTHCPYCALQCAMTVRAVGDAHIVAGDPDFDVNAGELCMKGYTAGETLAHPDRLMQPLVRRDGRFEEVGWEEALDVAAAGFRRIRAERGADAVAAFGSGALTNEKAYAFGKFARLALETANFDYNGRFCMSSAKTAANRSLGLDRGLPFPLRWIGEADVVLIAAVRTTSPRSAGSRQPVPAAGHAAANSPRCSSQPRLLPARRGSVRR